MTRAKDISKIVTDADLSGTLDVTGTMTVGGNVGIGTSSPSSYSSTTLEVKGSSTTSAIKMTNSTTGGGDAVGFDFEMNSNDMNFVNRTSSGVQKFWTNATERMRITSSGNVGIGTSSPTDVRLTLFSGGSGTAGQLKLGFDSNDFFQIGRNDIAGAGGGNFQIKPNGGTSIFDITSGGNVGIGVAPETYSNGKALQINSSAINDDNAGSLHITQNGYFNSAWKYVENGTAEKITYGSGAITFSNASNNSSGADASLTWSERMRIDSDGRLLVGMSVASGSSNGIQLIQDGRIFSTVDNQVSTVLNRKTSDGVIIDLRQDGSTIGGIYSSPSITGPFIGHINVGLAMYHNGDSVLPSGTGGLRDNAIDLGNSSNRFDDIYATNSTIQTSDRNEKQDIEELSEAEQRVAVVAKGLMRKYRWRDAVTEKGENARTHFGIIAQDLQDAFTAEGLDASDYAMFTSTTWWEKEISVDAVEADEENGIEAKDAYTYKKIAEEATEGYIEKTRLGVRYSELLAFIISAI